MQVETTMFDGDRPGALDRVAGLHMDYHAWQRGAGLALGLPETFSL